MKPSHISSTNAARTFADIVARVRYRNEEFIVEKAGRPVCRIVPLEPAERVGSGADLVRILKEHPLDEDLAEDEGSGLQPAEVSTSIPGEPRATPARSPSPKKGSR